MFRVSVISTFIVTYLFIFYNKWENIAGKSMTENRKGGGGGWAGRGGGEGRGEGFIKYGETQMATINNWLKVINVGV